MGTAQTEKVPGGVVKATPRGPRGVRPKESPAVPDAAVAGDSAVAERTSLMLSTEELAQAFSSSWVCRKTFTLNGVKYTPGKRLPHEIEAHVEVLERTGFIERAPEPLSA